MTPVEFVSTGAQFSPGAIVCFNNARSFAPPEMRSRILGVLTVCIGTGPIGFVWVGWLAERIGAHNETAVTGVLGLLAMAATWRWWKDI